MSEGKSKANSIKQPSNDLSKSKINLTGSLSLLSPSVKIRMPCLPV